MDIQKAINVIDKVSTLSVMAGKVEKNLWEAIKNEEQK